MIIMDSYMRGYMTNQKNFFGLKQLFDLVKPGGSLVVGNFNRKMPTDIRFVMEYICDWKLIYRDEDEVLEFAKAISENQIDGAPQILLEPMGLNSFLKVVKKDFHLL